MRWDFLLRKFCQNNKLNNQEKISYNSYHTQVEIIKCTKKFSTKYIFHWYSKHYPHFVTRTTSHHFALCFLISLHFHFLSCLHLMLDSYCRKPYIENQVYFTSKTKRQSIKNYHLQYIRRRVNKIKSSSFKILSHVAYPFITQRNIKYNIH